MRICGSVEESWFDRGWIERERAESRWLSSSVLEPSALIACSLPSGVWRQLCAVKRCRCGSCTASWKASSRTPAVLLLAPVHRLATTAMQKAVGTPDPIPTAARPCSRGTSTRASRHSILFSFGVSVCSGSSCLARRRRASKNRVCGGRTRENDGKPGLAMPLIGKRGADGRRPLVTSGQGQDEKRERWIKRACLWRPVCGLPLSRAQRRQRQQTQNRRRPEHPPTKPPARPAVQLETSASTASTPFTYSTTTY